MSKKALIRALINRKGVIHLKTLCDKNAKAIPLNRNNIVLKRARF
jgi:hypothetical protein